MENKLITVIIPIYNVQQYLPKCIESVLNQTYSNLEIILVDDGSSDLSGSICDEYAERDKRIKVVHQETGGVSSARNTGLDHATGEFICWVDSDDYISSSLVAELYALVMKYDVNIAACNYLQGTEREYQFKSQDNNTPQLLSTEQAFDYLYKDGHHTFIVNASWGKLIKKNLYEGLRYPEGRIFEDIHVTYQLIGKCDSIIYTDEVLYYYFKHSKSIMHSPFDKHKQDYLDALEARITYFREKKYYDLYEKARISFLHSLMWEFSRSKDILKDKKSTDYIIEKYRQYYKEGDHNPLYKHETVKYMSDFNRNPYLLDIKQKIKSKLGK